MMRGKAVKIVPKRSKLSFEVFGDQCVLSIVRILAVMRMKDINGDNDACSGVLA